MGRKRKVFLDTNAIIYFLDGVEKFALLGEYKTFYYSFITEIELLSYEESEGKKIISQFLKRGKRIDISKKIISKTIEIRRDDGLKLPDAIIVASAKSIGADLYTSDREIIRKIDFIKVINLMA